MALLVMMPKAAMNKDDLATPPEYQVGATRQTSIMEAVAISKGIYQPTNRHFGLGILTPN
jgi:hypothetical protein